MKFNLFLTIFLPLAILISMHHIQEKLLKLSKIRDLSELSIREIGRQIADGDSNDRIHPQLVKYHMAKLVDAKLIKISSRPLRKVESSMIVTMSDFISIPIVGSANCGPATIFANERVKGNVKISSSLLKTKNYQNLFALEASGNSMNRANIEGKSIDDGDYVIVDSGRRTPKTGEYVVVVDNDLANIKKIHLDYVNEQIVLLSESSSHFDPIFIDPRDTWDSLIAGTVIQIVKQPK